MEGCPSETKNPPALALGKSTLEEKLAMTSPNNNVTIIDSQRPFAPSRPRSRSGRPRNRRKSYESLTAFEASGINVFNHINSIGTSDDRGNLMTPNNSNHSLSRPDATATTGHEAQKQKGRPGRQRPKPRNRRRSFDPTLLSPTLMAQAVNEVHNQNYKSALEEKLAMTSPNNSNNRFDTQRIPTASGPRSRTGRRRNRRSSMPQITLPPSLLSPESAADKSPEKEEINQQIPVSNSSGHGRRQKPSMSLPSSSGHSGWSYYTEMTVHTDTQLLANDKEDTGESADDSSSCYYSDGGIAAYEKKMYMSSRAISVDDDDFDDDDDSSNSNFNYEGRDNGSLKTLQSAFSLSELGSNDSVSSLSIDDGDSNGENDYDKRIQFRFSPTNSTRQRQRQQSRSCQSIGRRRRNHSVDSNFKSGDEYEELTVDEDLTLDGSIPDLPNLPNTVANENTSYNKSKEEYAEEAVDEEVTEVEVLADDENEMYIEEVSLNDVSQKRYEILISEESFEEEVLINDDDEEEITVEDDDPLYNDPPSVEVLVDYKSDVDSNDSSDDEIPEYIADGHSNVENIVTLSSTDAKSVCGEDGRGGDHGDFNSKDSSPNIGEKTSSSSEHYVNSNEEDCLPNIHGKAEGIVLCDDGNSTQHRKDCQNEDNKDDVATENYEKEDFIADCQIGDVMEDSTTPMINNRKCNTTCHAPPSIDEKIEFSVNDGNGDDKNNSPLSVLENLDTSDDSRRNHSNEDAPSMIGEKTDHSMHFSNGDKKQDNALRSQSDKNEIDALKDINGKKDLSTDRRSSVDKIDTIQNGVKPEYGADCKSDFEKKDDENSNKNSECSSGYLGDDTDCAKPKSYRDVLMGT